MKKLFSSIVLLLVLSLTNSFAQNKTTDGSVPQKEPVALSYGLVVDNSGSYRLLMDGIVQTVKDIVKENKADDETFLVRFVSTDKISLLQDFTASKDAIQEAADEMYVEGGLTAILDGVDFAARHLIEKSSKEPARRKVLILLTDGDDRQSSVKIEQVLKFLKDNQIRVFALGISEEKVSMRLLDKLTKETGGRNYVPKKPAEVPAMVKELSITMRTQ